MDKLFSKLVKLRSIKRVVTSIRAKLMKTCNFMQFSQLTFLHAVKLHKVTVIFEAMSIFQRRSTVLNISVKKTFFCELEKIKVRFVDPSESSSIKQGLIVESKTYHRPYFPMYKRPHKRQFKQKFGKEVTALQYLPVLL